MFRIDRAKWTERCEQNLPAFDELVAYLQHEVEKLGGGYANDELRTYTRDGLFNRGNFFIGAVEGFESAGIVVDEDRKHRGTGRLDWQRSPRYRVQQLLRGLIEKLKEVEDKPWKSAYSVVCDYLNDAASSNRDFRLGEYLTELHFWTIFSDVWERKSLGEMSLWRLAVNGILPTSRERIQKVLKGEQY